MRRFVTGWMVAVALTALASAAWAGNQEVAEQIAQGLRQSGKMQDYKIGVKYQQGTVWLVGRVASEEQLTTALNLVMQTPHVDRVVNHLSVAKPDSEEASSAPESGRTMHDAVPTMAASRKVSAPLAHPSGLTAAERLQRAVDNRNRNVSSQSDADTETIHKGNEAERVPSSFEPVPAQPTSALEPTPAPLEPAHGTPSAKGQSQVARRPVPVAYSQPTPAAMGVPGMAPGGPRPMYTAAAGSGVAPARYDQPRMPNHAWPSYAAYPNYAAVTYPKQYSPTAWPYIGPFYPYPQVPLGWRKVTLEWRNGWWMLDFKDR